MNEKSHIPHPFEIFGVECHKGWFELLKPIFSYVQEYNRDKEEEEQIKFLQIKEKWGMDVSDTEELAADMMSLLASFSGKFYGKRSAERRRKKRNE